MNLIGWGSTIWLALTLCAVTWTGLARVDAPIDRRSQVVASSFVAATDYELLPDGRRGLADANGYVVPVAPYARIGSGSTIADGILLAMLEPERIAALTNYGYEHNDESHRYGDRPRISSMTDLEGLLALKLDLVLTNHVGNEAQGARAREAGLHIFNLGEMRGLSTLRKNIETIAALVGVPERGKPYADKLERRMRAIRDSVPVAERKTAMYVGTYANQLFGGAVGTSYDDVITHAGLIDAAAAKYKDWPSYDPEQLLELDPELIVTHEGKEVALCRVAGLGRLRACANKGKGVIGIPPDLIGDPGLRMLEATELLHDRVYGASPL